MSNNNVTAAQCRWTMLMAVGLALSPALALFAASDKEQNRALADALFTNHTILRLSLEIPEDGMESLRKAPREYVRASLREGDIVHSNIAVHLKGGAGSFRKVDDRPGLTLDFNRFVQKGRFHGLKKLHLNNSAQDATRLSEYIGGQLFREAGVPAARAAHALVELNGRRLGLYVIMEAMDSDFLSRYFKNNNGNLYGQTRGCDVTDQIERMEGDAPLTYEDLKALADAVLEPDPAARLRKMQQTLDVDRFLSFMATENLLTHTDSYTYGRHNYRIYQDLDIGRMVFFPHDLDQLMKRPNLGFLSPPRGLVAQAVLNTPELGARFQARISYLATNFFVVPRLTNRVDRVVAAVLPTIQAYDPEIAMAFTNTAAEFKTRIATRGLKLQRQVDILSGRLAPLAFQKDIAKLTDWRPDPGSAAIRLDRAKTEGRKSALWIKFEGTNLMAASWRTQVLLDPGWYCFEGLVSCAGVDTQRKRRGEGAGLYAPSLRQFDQFRLTGDWPWQKMTAEFELTGKDDIELACELRADKGEAWFAEDSLRLIRLPPEMATNLAARARKSPNLQAAHIEKAMETVKVAAAEAAKDQYRPVFHFRPPAQWMNDVCGVFYYQGRYHVFFQFNPWSDNWGKGTGWGHARSQNLVRWEFLPPALLPDPLNGSILDGSGSAVLDGYGSPILFYTHTPEGRPKNKREQWAALPEDETLLRWRRVNIGLAPAKSGVPASISPSWADMFVFRSSGRTFATFKESKGLICEALNPKLTQWKAVGKIPDLVGECPNFFPLDGRYVLINSAYPISYRVGDFDTNKITFRCREKEARILDYGPTKKESADGRGLYGTTVFTDAKGRVILLGWISGFKTNRAWNGVMSLPRVLRLNGDQLLQEPLPELTMLRDRPAVFKPTLKSNSITNTARALDTVRGDTLEVTMEIKPGAAKAFGVRLRGPEPGPGDIVIRQTATGLNVAGREVPCVYPAGQIFKGRLFFDKSVLEAFFADGQVAVSRVVYPATSNLRVEVFAEEGDIQVQKLEVWSLRPIW